MASFSATAAQSLAGLAEHGFVPATAAAHPEFVAFVRRASELICYYLLVRDDRSGGGSVRAYLWVAPVTSPDDAAGRVGIGEKLSIIESATPDPGFFSDVRDRVVAVLPRLPELAREVERRYATQADPSRALQVNRRGRALLGALRRYAATDSGRYVAPLFTLAADVARGRAPLSALEGACTDTAMKFFHDAQAPAEVSDPIFRGMAALIGTVLARQLYMDALAPYAGQDPASPTGS